MYTHQTLTHFKIRQKREMALTVPWLTVISACMSVYVAYEISWAKLNLLDKILLDNAEFHPIV